MLFLKNSIGCEHIDKTPIKVQKGWRAQSRKQYGTKGRMISQIQQSYFPVGTGGNEVNTLHEDSIVRLGNNKILIQIIAFSTSVYHVNVCRHLRWRFGSHSTPAHPLIYLLGCRRWRQNLKVDPDYFKLVHTPQILVPFLTFNIFKSSFKKYAQLKMMNSKE